MSLDEEKLARFVDLLEWHGPEEGFNFTTLKEKVGVFRASEPHSLKPEALPSGILIAGQGAKKSLIGGQELTYSAGQYMATFLPTPLESEITEASPEEPLLVVGIVVDMHKLASLLMRIEKVEAPVTPPSEGLHSGIYTADLDDDLLGAVIKLLELLKDPTDTAILSEASLEEVYYRLLRSENADSLRYLLQQREHIQQITRAVEHIHHHIDQIISVEKLADLVNMSKSAFYRSFKEVMHIPPLQYAKSMKLHRAQTLILQGKHASEAAYLVGYNSPAQFSREYKRQFGYSPSAT